MSVEPWDLSEFCFIRYCGRWSHFPQGHFKWDEECTNLEFSFCEKDKEKERKRKRERERKKEKDSER